MYPPSLTRSAGSPNLEAAGRRAPSKSSPTRQRREVASDPSSLRAARPAYVLARAAREQRSEVDRECHVGVAAGLEPAGVRRQARSECSTGRARRARNVGLHDRRIANAARCGRHVRRPQRTAAAGRAAREQRSEVDRECHVGVAAGLEPAGVRRQASLRCSKGRAHRARNVGLHDRGVANAARCGRHVRRPQRTAATGPAVS